ncbi:MAG: hypothetical protein H0U53_03750 [Actinobacteria bacterium]|nr:hypothetical protein [Actinomycetota bacterium]
MTGIHEGFPAGESPEQNEHGWKISRTNSLAWSKVAFYREKVSSKEAVKEAESRKEASA